MKKILFTIIIACCIAVNIATICEATTLKKGTFVAVSREIHDKMVDFAVRKDYMALAKLEQAGFIAQVPQDITVFITECHPFGCSAVRAEGQIQSVWVTTSLLED